MTGSDKCHFKQNISKWIASVALTILSLLIINILHIVVTLSYSTIANLLFINLSLYLYMMYKIDGLDGLFSPWKIFIFTFFIFYVFHIFASQFYPPQFVDYPFEYKTTSLLLKSANLFMFGSNMFFIGYEIAKKINIKEGVLTRMLITSFKSSRLLLLSNYVIIIIALAADFYNSYIYLGSIWGRLTFDYAKLQLGSLSILLYLYPLFLTNTLYLFLKYKLIFLHKVTLVSLSVFVLIIILISGSRGFIINFLFSSAYLIKYKIDEPETSRLFKRLRNKLTKANTLILIFILYIVNILTQLYRQEKSAFKLIDYIKAENLIWKYDTLELFLVTLRQFPSNEPHMPFYSIKNLLMWPIPRVYYSDKTIAFGKYLAYLIWPSFSDVSSAYCGITFGEFYANFGTIGMALTLMIIGIILSLINNSIGRNNYLNSRALIYSYLLLGLYGFYRGDFTTKTVHLFIPFVVTLFAVLIVSPLCMQKKERGYCR